MTTKKQAPKPPAASHMLWFFILPAIAFTGWAGWKLLSQMGREQPKHNLIEKIEKVSTAKSAGGRWQAAYSFAQDLQRQVQTGKIAELDTDEKNRLFDRVNSLIDEFPQDMRLKKYLILTLAQLKELKSLPTFVSHINSEDEDVAFYSAWGLVETLSAHPEAKDPSHMQAVLKWIDHESPSFKKIAASFLVRDEKYHDEVARLLNDEENEVRWNAAVALASERNPAGKETLLQMLAIHNIRAIGFRSSKDLSHFVATGIEAAEKLGDEEVLAAAKELIPLAEENTPEGRAIKQAIQGFSFQAR